MGGGMSGEKHYNQPGENVQEVSERGLELIKHFEGCYLHAYPDSVGVWTIGWGRIKYDDGRPVKQGESCTQEQANQWLLEDVEKDGAHYVRAWKSGLNQDQFDALTSFCFNRGAGRLRELLATGDIEKHIRDFDYAGEPRRILAGLARRRAAEFLMYRGEDWKQVDSVAKWKEWEARHPK